MTFITHYPELYGANRSLLNLIDGLRSHQVEPSVICHSAGPISDELAKRGIPHLVFPFRHWLNPHQPRHFLNGLYRFMENLLVMPELTKQVKRWRPDIIYSNSSAFPVGALLARILGKPHVWHVREFGELDYQLQHDLGQMFFRFWLNRATVAVAISQSVKSVVLGRVKCRTEVVANGVISRADLDRLATTAPLDREVFTFALVGLVHPTKGQREAIEALARVQRKFPAVRLLLAGTGAADYVQQLKNLAEELGVGAKVSFLGFVEDIFSVYGRAEAVLMCSRFEAMGRVTAEAMAAGKPVIGQNSGGTAEIIEHMKTGLLYDGTEEKLPEYMELLLQNPRLRLELGRNAREKAKENYTIEAYAEKISQILQSVVPARSGNPPADERNGGRP